MKYSLALALLFFISLTSYSKALNSDNNSKIVIQQDYENTRFIALGASITNDVFSVDAASTITDKINIAYPDESVEVFNEAVSGYSINSLRNNIDAILARYINIPTTRTFCPIHIGGNDVSTTRPYTSLIQSDIDILNSDLDYIIDAIEAKGFIPILFDLTFRDYDDTTNENEENGSEPYNDNIIKPKILERTPEFAFDDGESFMQAYVVVFNNYETYLDEDNIHLIDEGLDPFRDQFVNSICRYIFEGTIPDRITKDGEVEIIRLDEDNTVSEMEYYDSFFLPQSEASTLQEALDTYGAVRLGEGDYTAAGDITMTTNQRLYGVLKQRGSSIGGNITIRNGSNNVHIENYDGEDQYDIIFENGSPITGCTLSSIYYSELVLNNGSIEDNVFTNISRCTTSFDCSQSGYFRNNQFIKIYQQSSDDQVTMIGNEVTPSYGNIELSRNILTNNTNSTLYQSLVNHKLLGYNADSWASTAGASANAAFYFRDIGNLKMFNGNGYSSSGAAEFDIEADELIMVRKNMLSESTPTVRANTDFLGLWVEADDPINEIGVWEFLAHSSTDGITELNDLDLSNALTGTDANILENLILDTEHTPLPKPTFEILSNPTGENWDTERIGKIDESEYIQALIDANGIAELENRIYYIGSTLFLEDKEGIIGQGTGKTAIVGLTDDFPLISCQDDLTPNADPNNIYNGQLTNVSYKIGHMTLQGGSSGIYVKPIGSETTNLQMTNTAWRHLVFRNQTNGIHLDSFFGLDNSFFYDLNFVDCNKGFYQEAQPRPEGLTGEWSTMMYIDDTVFYQCQFINCNIGVDMEAQRTNNLDAWVDCNFDGNEVAMVTSNANALYCANTLFTNTTGDYVQSGEAPMSYYSCDFSNNTSSTLFSKSTIYAEGCNFNDTMPFNIEGNNGEYYLLNNQINNTIELSNVDKGFLINNEFTSDSSLNRVMIEVIDGTAGVILDIDSNPYPQLLVRQNEENILSTGNNPLDSEVSVYPNPTNANVTIHTDIKNIDSYEIFDLNGRLVSSGSLDIANATNTIAMSQLQPTFYMLKVFYKDNFETFKILKK